MDALNKYISQIERERSDTYEELEKVHEQLQVERTLREEEHLKGSAAIKEHETLVESLKVQLQEATEKLQVC